MSLMRKGPIGQRLEHAEGFNVAHGIFSLRWYRAPELLYGARKYDEGVDLW